MEIYLCNNNQSIMMSYDSPHASFSFTVKHTKTKEEWWIILNSLNKLNALFENYSGTCIIQRHENSLTFDLRDHINQSISGFRVDDDIFIQAAIKFIDTL
jgi:hypothetical protein